jgi:hypothetical protein
MTKTYIKRLTAGLLAIAVAQVTYAVTSPVPPSTKIQDAVDAASDGDVLILLEGVFNEDVVVQGKNVRLVREKGKSVEISGSLTYKDVNGTVVLRDLKIGRYATNHLTLENCEKVGIEDLDLSTGGGLVVTNSDVVARSSQFAANLNIDNSGDANATVEVIDCTFASSLNSSITGGSALLYNTRFEHASASLTIDGANWAMHECFVGEDVKVSNAHTKLIRSRVNRNLYHYHATLPDGNASECTVYQSTVDDYLESNASRSWIGYNTIKYMQILGDATEAEIVGNDIYKGSGGGHIIHIDAPGLVADVRNNLIRYTTTNNVDGVNVRRGSKIRIHNNIFHYIMGDAIEVHADANQTEIMGNVFAYIRYYAVRAPMEGVTCRHNWVYDRGQIDDPYYFGGVIFAENQENKSGDPLFVAYHNNALSANNDYRLQANSPLKDAGPPEAHFNDHNGTRNDIGMYGGHAYDPEGTTSVKPVVISGSHSPKKIYIGFDDPTVRIKARGAVSSPKQ